MAMSHVPVAAGDSASPESSSVPKRKRASKPKVKTGCIVCKIRRVKCDETKPACVKCTSTGRKCEGYEQQLGELAASRRQRAESEQSSPEQAIRLHNKVAIPRRPSPQVLPTDDPAHDSFDFFRLNTVAAIERGSGYKLWTSIVLQLSESVPAVRLAAAALGCLSRRMQLIDTFRSKEALGIVMDQAVSLQQAAEKEYARALRSLREHLSRSDDEAAETGLVSCWLMYAFEFLRGNAQAAIVHQVSGISILQKHLKMIEMRGSESRITSLRSQILVIFGAWDERTKVWLGLDRPLMETVAAADDPSSIPMISELDRRSIMPANGFSNLQEACLSQRQIIICIMFLRHRLNTWLVVESDHSYYDLETERQRLLGEIGVWRAAFDTFLSDHWFDLSTCDHYLATLLNISGRAASLRLSALLQASEPQIYAPRATELIAILDLAEGLIRPENVMKGQDGDFACIAREQAAAYYNVGLIQPLYHVAVKTTHPELRKRAIELLEREPWEEGGFDSREAAVIARRFTSAWDLVEMSGRTDHARKPGYYHQGHLVPMVG